MKCAFVLLAVLAALCVVSANPKYLCYHKESNYYIRVDTTKAATNGVCLGHYCEPKSMEVQEVHCGLLNALGSKEKPCHITVEDLTQSYPDCCPKLVCPK